MKKMFFMLTLVMLFLVSCGKDSSESGTGSGEAGKENKKKIKIGMSIDDLRLERWQKDRDIFKKAAEELGAELGTGLLAELDGALGGAAGPIEAPPALAAPEAANLARLASRIAIVLACKASICNSSAVFSLGWKRLAKTFAPVCCGSEICRLAGPPNKGLTIAGEGEALGGGDIATGPETACCAASYVAA